MAAGSGRTRGARADRLGHHAFAIAIGCQSRFGAATGRHRRHGRNDSLGEPGRGQSFGRSPGTSRRESRTMGVRCRHQPALRSLAWALAQRPAAAARITECRERDAGSRCNAVDADARSYADDADARPYADDDAARSHARGVDLRSGEEPALGSRAPALAYRSAPGRIALSDTPNAHPIRFPLGSVSRRVKHGPPMESASLDLRTHFLSMS